jgi:hypothetical protein
VSDCLELQRTASGVLNWNQGMFTVTQGSCTRTYSAPIVQSLDQYQDKYGRVNMVINRNAEFLLARP